MSLFILSWEVGALPALENVKWEAFCLHYAKTGNATESYKKAGYKATTETAIYSNANRLLKNDKVKARLQELAEELAGEKIANIKEVQEKLTAILRGEDKEEKMMVKGLGELEINKIVNQANQIKAAELLAKMQGGFTNNHNVAIAVPVFEGEGDLID